MKTKMPTKILVNQRFDYTVFKGSVYAKLRILLSLWLAKGNEHRLKLISKVYDLDHFF
jgi:hypothetical protein